MVEEVVVGAVVEDVKPTDVVVLAGTATPDVVAGEAVVVLSEVPTAQAVVMTMSRGKIA